MAVNLSDIRLNLKQFNNGINLNDGLGDTLPVVVNKLNTNFNILTQHVREKLTAVRTYYISPQGSILNTGLSASQPLPLISKALDIIYKDLDLNGYQVIISLADGSYSENLIINDLPLGSSSIEYPILIEGNVSDPSLTIINFNTNVTNTCIAVNKSRLALSNLTFDSSVNSSNTSAVDVKDGSLTTTNIIFEDFNSNSQHINLTRSTLTYGTHTIRGNNKYHIYANASIVIRKLSTTTWFFGSLITTALIRGVNYSYISINNNLVVPSLGFSGSGSGLIYSKDFSSTILFNINPNGFINTQVDPIDINSNLEVDNLRVKKDITVDENSYLNSNLYVGLNTNLNSNLEVTGGSTFTGLVTVNTLKVQGNTTFDLNTVLSVEGALKSLNSNEFGLTSFKETVTFDKDVTFFQGLIAEGSVILPNNVINIGNLSASGTLGTLGNQGDVLIKNPGVAGGLQWSNRLSELEVDFTDKAPLANPDFTGVPTVPTPSRNSNTKQVANTEYVTSVINYTVEQLLSYLTTRVPEKLICSFAGSIEQIQTPWVLCDGTQGTPDLRERFILGAGKQTGQAFCVNETGGVSTNTSSAFEVTTSNDTVSINLNTTGVALNKDQIPAHNHFDKTMVYYGGNALPINVGAGGGKGGSTGTTVAFLSPVNETTIGGSQPHAHTILGNSQPHSHIINIPANTTSNLPPYYVLAYIMLSPTTYTFTIQP